MVNGVLIGKFHPPHKGHDFLLDFAHSYVDDLLVLISHRNADVIPPETRLSWMTELCPQASVALVEADTDRDSVETWVNSIRDILGTSPNYLFASEGLGQKLATRLGSHLVINDPPIASIELESKAILADPSLHWGRLKKLVMPHFLKRVCVFGPESTGKSTLCQMLANHFRTVAVPEYARIYLERKQTLYEIDDVVPVARGQHALEQASLYRAQRVLFCDTDMLTTKIWSDWLFGQTDPWVENAIGSEKHDLYLLTTADVPWVEDPVRYLPNDRYNFERKCEESLHAYDRRFVKISGSWDERLETAVEAVEALLAE